MWETPNQTDEEKQIIRRNHWPLLGIRGDISTNSTHVKWTIRKYYEIHYGIRFNSFYQTLKK